MKRKLEGCPLSRRIVAGSVRPIRHLHLVRLIKQMHGGWTRSAKTWRLA
jgi:hypothetical protein